MDMSMIRHVFYRAPYGSKSPTPTLQYLTRRPKTSGFYIESPPPLGLLLHASRKQLPRPAESCKEITTNRSTEAVMYVDPYQDMERNGDGDGSEDAPSAEDGSDDDMEHANDDMLNETTTGSRRHNSRKRTKRATTLCFDELPGRAEAKSDSTSQSDPACRRPGK
ncbi:hypothetical protein GN958_ATG12834 [Phytophthora infestans]|uniref:Uncharacterized protein n=1 Tax=Phytophthora infestans TaxID=4787 RepID=A0A8S9UAN3_PHYIN|nr:hypothetical protein GN958_ATG12834 [Phytophthora infestans]